MRKDTSTWCMVGAQSVHLHESVDTAGTQSRHPQEDGAVIGTVLSSPSASMHPRARTNPHTHTHTHVHACTPMSIHTCHTCVHVVGMGTLHTCEHTHTYIHVTHSTPVRTCMHMHTHNAMYTYVNTYMHRCTHSEPHSWTWGHTARGRLGGAPGKLSPTQPMGRG